MRRNMMLASLAVLSGCVTQGAVSPMYKLDPNAGNECKAHCESLGMDLGAVVIIATSTGCVCQPREQRAVSEAGASAVAGGAVFAMRRAAENQASQSSRSSR